MAAGKQKPRLVRLVGLFKRLVDPQVSDGFSLGGYIDTLTDAPYSLANAYLMAYCGNDRDLRHRYRLEPVTLLDRSPPTTVSFADAQPAATTGDDPHPFTGARRVSSGEEAAFRSQDIADLARNEPAAVCFSSYCWNIDAVLDACAQLKARMPQVRTVIGGRAAEGRDAEILSRNPHVDFVITGEGEVPFMHLLRSDFAPTAPHAGLSFRDANGAVVAAGPPAPLADLDTLPSPYLSGCVTPSPESMLMELSRGCPNRCGYCGWNSSKVRRHFSPERIQDELRWAVRAGVRHITLIDSAINYETDRLEQFVDALSRADPQRRLSFTYNLRHEHVDPVQAGLLRKIPSRQILLGMESLTVAALDRSGRTRFDRKKFEQALCRIAPVAPPVIGVVLGLPGDTVEGFVATMEYLGLLATKNAEPIIGAVLVSLLQVFPGTPMYDQREAMGFDLPDRGIPYVTGHRTFSMADLQACVRFLQVFRMKYPVLVKGPEGFSVLAATPDGDAMTALIYRLLEPWKKDELRDLWQLESAKPIPDGEGFAILTFRRDGCQDRLKIRLDRRDPEKECYLHTRLFNLYYLDRPPERIPPSAVESLLERLTRIIRKNESALR